MLSRAAASLLLLAAAPQKRTIAASRASHGRAWSPARSNDAPRSPAPHAASCRDTLTRRTPLFSSPTRYLAHM